MPNQPKTKNRGIRIPDDEWARVQAEAVKQGVSASDVVREAIRKHVEGKP